MFVKVRSGGENLIGVSHELRPHQSNLWYYLDALLSRYSNLSNRLEVRNVLIRREKINVPY
jgi:hypothetical protein